MNLYRIQDDDRPCYVIASDWTQALFTWKAQMQREDPSECDVEEPDGIELIAKGIDVQDMPEILFAPGVAQ